MTENKKDAMIKGSRKYQKPKITLKKNNVTKKTYDDVKKHDDYDDDDDDNVIRYVDLFAGTGAFSLVLKQKGGSECVFANDLMSSSEKIYKLNHPDHPFRLGDLNEIEVSQIPRHDLLCAGFPCQPFSIAGRRLGFEDKRANVFWKIIEILSACRPRFVVLENVKNLKTHDKGNTYQTIMSELEKLGYLIKSQVLDTRKITQIPHHRERIYIVCFRDQADYDRFNFDFPCVKNQKIKALLEKTIPEKYYYTDKLKVYNKVKEGVVKKVDENVLYQYRRYYVRENMSGCCPTLTANMGSGGHNVPLLLDDHGIRKLTPRECFNLQGFPSDYQLPALSNCHNYKLAGNAVSVPVVKLIMDKLW